MKKEDKMIRLLTKADAKQYWELRLQALQVKPRSICNDL